MLSPGVDPPKALEAENGKKGGGAAQTKAGPALSNLVGGMNDHRTWVKGRRIFQGTSRKARPDSVLCTTSIASAANHEHTSTSGPRSPWVAFGGQTKSVFSEGLTGSSDKENATGGASEVFLDLKRLV